MKNIPVYKHPAAYAGEHDELAAYRTSNQANTACKEAIEAAIRDHYRDNRLDAAAVDQVVQQFGYDRAFHILAITVCQADWDRRYSPDNRAWANAMSIPANPDAWGTDRNCYLAVNSHPGLVDLFLSQTRKAYAKQRGVEQAAHGVYVSPDAWTDAMYLLHLRCAQAVFSHESALFFHDLTDREPNPYSITVKTGYNPASLQADGIKVYTIKKELHDVGIVTMNTPFGNPVPVYDMERTICDLIRSRSGIEMQTFQDALKQYAKRKDKDLRKLMRYAQMFRVEKLLRQYLEVLL